MRWLLILPVIALIYVSVPGGTSAHTLTITGAIRVANKAAAKNAASISDLYNDSVTARVRKCKRVNRIDPHKVDCFVEYRFAERKLSCTQVYRVRFSSRTRPRVRVDYPSIPTCRPVG